MQNEDEKFQTFAANVDAALKTLRRLRRRMKALEVEGRENGYEGGAFPTALREERAAAFARLKEWLEDAKVAPTLDRNARARLVADRMGATVMSLLRPKAKGSTKRKQ